MKECELFHNLTPRKEAVVAFTQAGQQVKPPTTCTMESTQFEHQKYPTLHTHPHRTVNPMPPYPKAIPSGMKRDLSNQSLYPFQTTTFTNRHFGSTQESFSSSSHAPRQCSGGHSPLSLLLFPPSATLLESSVCFLTPPSTASHFRNPNPITRPLHSVRFILPSQLANLSLPSTGGPYDRGETAVGYR